MNNVYALNGEDAPEYLGTCRTSPKQKMREIVDKSIGMETDNSMRQLARTISMDMLVEFYTWYENEQRLIQAKRVAGNA